MNLKKILLLCLFPPYGFYLLIKNKRTQKSAAHQKSYGNTTDLSSLSSEDLELIIFGIVAFWGDNLLSKKEMNILVSSYKERLKHLTLGILSDPSDADLSCKEYLLQLFDMISEMSNNAQEYEDIIIPEEYLKKKGENYQPSTKDKIFFMVIDLVYDSYERNYKEYKYSTNWRNNVNRKIEVEKAKTQFLYLTNQVKALAKADGLDDGEKEMLKMMKTKISGSFWIKLIMFIQFTLIYVYTVYTYDLFSLFFNLLV